jgi:asparagine synthase (glutamine-hydrolysing)
MLRYLAMCWDVSSSKQQPVIEALQDSVRHLSPQWSTVFDGPGMRVLCAGERGPPNRIRLLSPRGGVVVGALFQRLDAESSSEVSNIAGLDGLRSERILASDGREFVKSYWGNYVAFLVDETGSKQGVLKGPTGTLPCFMTTYEDVTLFFSCIADCARIPLLKFSINWPWVRARVATGFLGTNVPPLQEVTEVHHGECVRFDHRRQTSEFYWHPLTFAESDPIEDFESAASQLRVTSKACARAWMDWYGGVVHRLSGGFDSAAVLGCLANGSSASNVACMTLYSPSGHSDERPWARLAAQRAGCRHAEYQRNPRVDLRVMLEGMPTASPEILTPYVEAGPIERSLATETNAKAVADGEGGDALFGRHARHWAGLEYIRWHGLRFGLLRVCEIVALRTERSLWSVLAQALRNTVFPETMRRQHRNIRMARRLVSADLVETTLQQKAYPHAWFQSIDHVPWSLVSKLSTLLHTPSFYDPFRDPSSPDPEPVSPLCSQPIVELCLKIPTYVHMANGRDRGLARAAFSRDIPPEIVARQWKDRAPRYFEEMMFWNRGFFREALCDGILMREGFLDKKKIEEATSDGPTRSVGYASELLDHVCLEGWLQTWRSIERRRAA